MTYIPAGLTKVADRSILADGSVGYPCAPTTIAMGR